MYVCKSIKLKLFLDWPVSTHPQYVTVVNKNSPAILYGCMQNLNKGTCKLKKFKFQIGHIQYILTWPQGFQVKIAILLKFLLSLDYQKRLKYRDNTTKYGWKFVPKISELCCTVDILNMAYWYHIYRLMMMTRA